MSIEPIYKKIKVITIHALINSDMCVEKLFTLINGYDVDEGEGIGKKRRYDKIYKATYYSTPTFFCENFLNNSDILNSMLLKEIVSSLKKKERVELRALNSVAISIINKIVNEKYPNLFYKTDYQELRFISMDNLKIIPLDELVTRYYYDKINLVNYKNILTLFKYDVEPAYDEAEKRVIDEIKTKKGDEFLELGKRAIIIDKCIDHIRDEIIEVDIIDYFEENLPLKSFPYKNLGINIDGSFESVDIRNICKVFQHYKEFLGNQLLATIIYSIKTCKGEDRERDSLLYFLDFLSKEKKELIKTDNPFLKNYIDKIKRELGIEKIENEPSAQTTSKGVLLIREISADIKSEIP